MAERRYTVVCIFEPTTPKIIIYDIHEWIHDTLRIPEKTVNTIQIYGRKRHVYIKLAEAQCIAAVLRDSCGQAEYRHNSGEISIVSIAMAGMGTKNIRIANLLLEVPDESLRSTVSPIWQSRNNTGRNVVAKIQIRSGQWHTTGYNDADPTYPVQSDHRRAQGTPIPRRPASNMLWKWRNWSHVSILSQGTQKRKYNVRRSNINISEHCSTPPQRGVKPKRTRPNEHHPPNR